MTRLVCAEPRLASSSISAQFQMASVITSKPAINDHFKTGQRSRAQDMKLFYRAGGSSSKLILFSF